MARRGIQLGQVATDEFAARLDGQCKTLSIKILDALRPTYGDELSVQKKLNQPQIPGGVGACAPDGCLWFWKGTLIAAFEAKKQQDAGNAIERWYKNNFICRLINPAVSYVTFATGDGARVGGVIHKALAVAHLKGFDTYVPSENSCWMNPNGFTDEEVERIMTDVIVERIKTCG